MCISASASIKSFSINLISSLALIVFGNKSLKTYNYIFAMFSIYVSLMQLVDYGIWIDLDCKKGFNKASSLFGPILNYFQPLALYAIMYIIFNYTSHGKITKLNVKTSKVNKDLFNNFSILSKKKNITKILTILYTAFIVYTLYKFYTRNNIFCTKLDRGHLKWKWLSYDFKEAIVFGYVYLIVIYSILFVDPNSNYVKLVMFLYFVLLMVSYIKNSLHMGEIWCYLSNSIPLLLLLAQKVFKIST